MNKGIILAVRTVFEIYELARPAGEEMLIARQTDDDVIQKGVVKGLLDFPNGPRALFPFYVRSHHCNPIGRLERL